MSKSFTSIIILDGWGIGKEYPGNAILKAKTPVFDALAKENPYTEVAASGLAVGLPEGQMGNSEVGHLNMGAGRVIYQEFTRISKSILDGDFFQKEEFKKAIENSKNNNSSLHLMGLLSPGGVHSHSSHLYALLEYAKSEGLKDVYIHCFLDGRDVPPASGKTDVIKLQDKIQELGIGKIATISGRYYAMDRDNRWDRIEKAYDAILLGKGDTSKDPVEAVGFSYQAGITDEFVVPTVIMESDKPVATLENNDSVIFFNFRPDRARQLTRAIVDEKFPGFERKKKVSTFFTTMTQYDSTIKGVQVVYKPQEYENTLGEYLNKKGKYQLRIAETEKYPHVTFFFNGGEEKPNSGEDRALIPSPRVATYDLSPEMSALPIAEEAVTRIKSNRYDFMVLNFANPDMVGHTGVFDAAVRGVQTVDKCLGMVLEAIKEVGGKAIITADHGNAEQMLDYETGAVLTAHTTNPVPFIVIGESDISLEVGGALCDVAPTVLDMMGIEKPEEMTGKSLIKR